MSFISYLNTAVGTAVFIFGMLLIKYALRETYEERLKSFLVRFTENRLTAVLTGGFVTFAMQSSSASSVLTAAFADSGYIDLYRAFWIIVGANAGTAFTGIITAMDVTAFAPVLCVSGVIIISICKKKKAVGTGVMLTGAGLLFVGMKLVGDAFSDISSDSFLADLLIMCASPLTGILTGTFITALIQSSSAVTALLQTLGSAGRIGISHAYYIILGANIGTCATCAISCTGLSGTAKKVAVMHTVYNLAGALVFTLLSDIIPLPFISQKLFPESIKMQIAFINISFNILSAVITLMLPMKPLFCKNSQTGKRIFRSFAK